MSLLSCEVSNKREGEPKVLVFSKTAGFKHASIPAGLAAIQKLGQENGFKVDTTKNAELFNEDNLKQYSAVIFLNTTGNVLDYRQEAAFERYIQAGGGFVGVHAATDTEYDWGWYGKLVGAYFNGHPKIQEAKFIVKDQDFPATKFFTDSVWQRSDELYNFKKINPDIHVLLTIDEGSYEGGTNGDFHPMSWYHEYDGGRAFYTELGHTDESYTEDNYLKHLLGGIQYAIGDNEKLDYSKATTQFPPDEDRFTKTVLSHGQFFEPTEMTILPNLDILVIQRRGEIVLYDHKTQNLKEVGKLDVYWKTLHTPGVNAEEGMLGLQKDPNFETNHWIYIYYSPSEKSVNRLSRFTFKDNTFDKSSEKIILEVGSQREICCHTGGSIAFGPDGLLYVSSGDNSTPFNEKGVKYVNSGYAPLNDIPGHQQYDARRSSGNTNDLRGKILRIKVNDDGSYDIPEGNLFPKGTEKTRPEIYTMGHRNPYRISVDQKNGTLYWGEVGPDARVDSLNTRGPKGYDEVNQAMKAGNYGWPLFIGNNYPYVQYDYATGASGQAFDPEKPVNDSRNNTGLTQLPPTHPAFIWYPYDASPDFPEVGTGGRNAMAGPVYYSDMYPKESALPSYYDGKLIIYEWIRGWMKAVTMFPNGDFNKMEPFAPGIKLNALIDMEVGPDGKIYLLEYGSGWFSQNSDSGLARIDYNSGNRPPLVENLQVDKQSGVLPLTINATIEARDRENDAMTYMWDFGDGKTEETNTPQASHTFESMGNYFVSVTVKDDKNAEAKSGVIEVYAGNERPKVSIVLEGNQSIYMVGQPIKYEVKVTDNPESGPIDPANIYVSVDYAEGVDKASLAMGHQEATANIGGKALVFSQDCKTCHKENEKSIGPSFLDVANKYKEDRKAQDYLRKKIMEGGSGVWGDVSMPAHPDLSPEDLQQITQWIVSLAEDNQVAVKKTLPPSGTIVPKNDNPNSSMVITASYTDKGGNNSKPLTGRATAVLSSSTISMSEDLKTDGFSAIKFNGMEFLLLPATNGWFALDGIDLTGVTAIDINVGWQGELPVGLDFGMHLDSPDGKLIGKGGMPTPPSSDQPQSFGKATLKLTPVTDGKLHQVYFTYASQDPKVTAKVNAVVASVQLKKE